MQNRTLPRLCTGGVLPGQIRASTPDLRIAFHFATVLFLSLEFSPNRGAGRLLFALRWLVAQPGVSLRPSVLLIIGLEHSGESLWREMAGAAITT